MAFQRRHDRRVCVSMSKPEHDALMRVVAALEQQVGADVRVSISAAVSWCVVAADRLIATGTLPVEV
jgi:hypothetical protein